MGVMLAVLIVAVQVATGAAWWAWMRRGPSLVELLGMGLALGTFGSMVFSVLLQPTPIAVIGWLLPSAATAIAALIWRRPLAESLRGVSLPRPQGIGLIAGLIAGLVVVLANWLRTPLDAVTDKSYADIYFLEALSRGVAQFGPAQSILMTDGSLRYHWFTYAWIGELGQSAGLAPFIGITRVLPIVAMVGLVLLALSWTDLVQVRRSPQWVPTLAALLVVFGGYAGALYGSILNFDSPSQSLTTVWLMALGIAFVRFALQGGLGTGIATVVLAASVVGGKVSHAAVGLAGMAATSVLGAAMRTSWWRRAAAVTLLGAAAAAAAYVLVLSGAAIDRNLTEVLAVKASTWQGLDPLIGRWGAPAGTAALLLAMLARPAGLVWLLRRRSGWTDPAVLFATAGLGVGAVALIALKEGVNETWFALAASGAAGAVAAVGAGQAMSWAARHGIRRPLIGGLVIALVASAASLLVSLNWTVPEVWPPGLGLFATAGLLHWLAAVLPWVVAAIGALVVVLTRMPRGHRPTAWLAFALTAVMLTSLGTRPAAIWTAEREIQTETGIVRPTTALPGAAAPSADLEQRQRAAAWLVDRAAADDIVATSDPLSAFIPAQTGLRMYLAGDRYQEGLGDAGDLAEVEARRAVAAALAAGPTAGSIDALCSAGVRWVWIEGTSDWPSAYSEPGVQIADISELCG